MFFSITKHLILSLALLSISLISHSSDLELNVRIGDRFAKAVVYSGYSDDLIIWLPSQYATKPNYRILASKIKRHSMELWYVDMFAANYLIPSVNTINQIPAQQIADLISNSIRHSANKRIWLMSDEKGARLALRGAHEFKRRQPQDKNFHGILLINPDLTYGSPPVGDNPDYLPITSVMNQPIAILQARFSKNHYYVSELKKQLQKGGAFVRTYVIDNVRDRFYFRRFSETIEDKTRDNKLPLLLVQAMNDIRQNSSANNTKPQKALRNLQLPKVDQPLNFTPILNPKLLPRSILYDINGRKWSTQNMKEKVLFISIWPYWCNTCRYQLRQMQAFYQQNNAPDFNLLSISLDGTLSQIKKLVSQYNITFPLIKGDIDFIKQLNIRDFPSTLIIDKRGKIRYAMYGIAHQKNNPELNDIIQTLKSEK